MAHACCRATAARRGRGRRHRPVAQVRGGRRRGRHRPLRRVGAGAELFKLFGFTAEAVAERARRLLASDSQAAPRTSPGCASARSSAEPHSIHSRGACHGLDLAAPVAGPRGRARLRRAGLQREQHGADPGDHAGRAGDRQPGDPAGLGRRAQIRGRALPAPHGPGGGRDAPRHPDRAAPGPRREPAGLPAVDPLRLHQRDDGRLAAGRRQDAGELRLQRRRDARGRGDGARGGRVGRRRAGLPGFARDRPWPARRTACGAEGSSRTTSCSPTPSRPPTSSRSTGVDALAIAIGTCTAPTSSRASPPATSWPSTASARSTRASRTRTW